MAKAELASGIQQADFTDPKVREMFGLRLDGNKLVTDDADAVLVATIADPKETKQ
jgi:hypothetical protein